MRKKRVLLQTDAALAKTGFGRTAKAVLTYLYKTGKYDIYHYCLGVNWSHLSTHRTPWETVGSLPDDEGIMKQIQMDPGYTRQVNYGAYHIDKAVKKFKPDVFFAMQDIWGVDFLVDKMWWKEINSVIWTTLDSLPILPTTLKKAGSVDNFWVWADFAAKALHEEGHKHVKSVHGPLDCSHFKKLPDEDRVQLRLRFQQYLPMDAFVIGFVFRNQLRKSVPNLLEGYAKFRKKVLKQNPKKSLRLLLHTSWNEGWNIHKLAEEYDVPLNEILTTYSCRNCKEYGVFPFAGEEKDCLWCKSEKALNTTSTGSGVSESQLNEIYNFMDVYCHPFTSGGQELPIQEAKLCELVTLVTDYSCGEDMCGPRAGSLPLEWSEYREHNTHFRKASTCPNSIAEQLNRVYKMNESKRKKMGEEARQFVLEEYSIEKIGKFIEEFIDNSEFCEFDFSKQPEKDPFFQIPEESNDSKWLTSLYHGILKMKHIDHEDEGHKYWTNELSNGKTRRDVEHYFRTVAAKETKQATAEKVIGEHLSADDDGRRIIYLMPEPIGDIFLSTSLFRSIKETYPDYNLYVATSQEYLEILDGNPHVHAAIPFVTEMENIKFLEGFGDHKGWFEIAFAPYTATQIHQSCLHNGKDKVVYKDLIYED